MHRTRRVFAVFGFAAGLVAVAFQHFELGAVLVTVTALPLAWPWLSEFVWPAFQRPRTDDLSGIALLALALTLGTLVLASLVSASIACAGGIVAVLGIGVSLSRTYWRGGWAELAA